MIKIKRVKKTEKANMSSAKLGTEVSMAQISAGYRENLKGISLIYKSFFYADCD